VVEVVARLDRLVAVAQAVESGHDRRHFRDQADDRFPVALSVGHVAAWVEHAHGGDGGLQGVHRMAGVGQALDEIDKLIFDAAMVAELIVEIGELLLRGQLALEEEPGGFLEATGTSQRLHGDAAILQARILAVDEADRRLRHRHVGKARMQLNLAHGTPGGGWRRGRRGFRLDNMRLWARRGFDQRRGA
jgi:hypothetical protein